MAKSRDQYIAELQKLDTNKEIVVKDDHNVADIKAFIELLELRQANAEKQKQVEKLHDEVEELTEINQELNEALADATASKSDKTIAKVNGKKVEVVHSVNLKGKSYSVAQIAEDEKVIQELLKRGSSAVKVVEGK